MRIASTRSSGFSRSLLLVGSALAVGYGISKLLKRPHARRDEVEVSQRRQDKALRDTFPASDPPASQYFDIPVNRRDPEAES